MTIFLITIAYIIGIIMGLYTNIASVFLFIITIILIRIFFLFFSKFNNLIYNINELIKRTTSTKKLILLLTFFLISFFYIYSLESIDINIPEEAKIQAIVVSNCKEKEYKNVYKVKVESINNDKSYANTYFQLSVKNKNIKIEFGDRITFDGLFEQPSEARNYGGFDYKQYLKTNSIRGLITTSNISKIEKQRYNKILISINSISTKITENINNILNTKEASLLTSILIGNKNNLDSDVEQSFRDSNLSHLLAVSGAHTTYIILGVTTILNKLKIHKKTAKLLTIFFLIFFMILTGASPSVTRACIMAIYIIIGTLIYRKPNVIASISISVLIILIFNPYKILDVGLQLSCGGTLGIVLFSKLLKQKLNTVIEKVKSKFNFNTKQELNSKIKQKIKKITIWILSYIKEMVVVSFSANLFIFPIIAFHYNTFSFTFFISNVLAGPLLGIIIILGFLIVFISFLSVKIAVLFSFIISITLKILILVANFSSKLPLSKIYVSTPSVLTILFYYSVIILLSIEELKCLRYFLY